MNIIIIAIITLLVFALFVCYLKLGSVSYKKTESEFVPVEPLVKQGDKFKITRDTNVSGLTIWGAPYTGGFECILPAGTILVANADSWGQGFGVVPEMYNELEKRLVPETDRTAKKYGGYYFIFSKSDIGEIIVRRR